MDYRALVAAPLAAAAMNASSADALRQPAGWMTGASYAWPQGATHEAGVAPETEASGQRALTVKAIGTRSAHEIGSISQYAMGHAGKRVRFTAQVKATDVDGWAGLVVGSGFLPLWLQPGSPDAEATPPLGAAGCPQWCDVSVVADIPADGEGVANVGLALVGNGQVWARNVKLEVVGGDVPVTTQRFAVEAGEAMRAMRQKAQQMTRAAAPTPPRNLALQ
jgi:hypothetical protein